MPLLVQQQSLQGDLPVLHSWEEVVPAQHHLLCLSGQQAVLLQVWGHWYLSPLLCFLHSEMGKLQRWNRLSKSSYNGDRGLILLSRKEHIQDLHLKKTFRENIVHNKVIKNPVHTKRKSKMNISICCNCTAFSFSLCNTSWHWSSSRWGWVQNLGSNTVLSRRYLYCVSVCKVVVCLSSCCSQWGSVLRWMPCYARSYALRAQCFFFCCWSALWWLFSEVQEASLCPTHHWCLSHPEFLFYLYCTRPSGLRRAAATAASWSRELWSYPDCCSIAWRHQRLARTLEGPAASV